MSGLPRAVFRPGSGWMKTCLLSVALSQRLLSFVVDAGSRASLGTYSVLFLLKAGNMGMGSVEMLTKLVNNNSTLAAACEHLGDDNNALNTRASAREKNGDLDGDFALNTPE